MNAKETASRILKEVGGEENVQYLTHCVTRLRFNLHSMENVSENRIKNIPGVVGVVNKGGQFQVIIGQEVVSVYNALLALGDFSTGAASKSQGGQNQGGQNQGSQGQGGQGQSGQADEEKKGMVNRVLDTIAGIFSPIMSIIAGAGMIKALLSILTVFNLIDKSGNLYYFLNFIADASYYFLPIYLANSAAKKFGCNPFMAMLMGGILLHPNLSALSGTADVVSVVGLPVRIATYSSSVIPIIMIVFVLAYVEKFVEKITPSLIKFIAKPVLTILIMSPIALVVLGPLGSIIGDGLVSLLLAIEDVAPWILPTVIGAFMPFLVMTGMHYSLLPAYVNSLSALGYETIIGPGNLPSNIAQGAAALCVAVKTKNKEFRQLAVSSGLTALLGITEPALFGVNLRLKKPLIATTIGGGLGGLYAGITGVQRYGGGGAGLAAIGLYVGDGYTNVMNALIAAAIAFAATFAIQWYLGFEDVDAEPSGGDDGVGAGGSEGGSAGVSSGSGACSSTGAGHEIGACSGAESDTSKSADMMIGSPVDGEIIPISQVKDDAFASEVMGKTVAIQPENGRVYAPADGVIAAVFETKHAIGMTADNGAEILIHVGIDTVELNGKYFTAHAVNGKRVKKGELLLEFDKEAIEKAGYDPVTPVILSNSMLFENLKKADPGKVKAGEMIMDLQ